MKKFLFKKNHVMDANTGEFEPCIVVLEGQDYECYDNVALRSHCLKGFLDCEEHALSVEDLRKYDNGTPLEDFGTTYILL